MIEAIRFQYVDVDPSRPGMSLMPLVPITLSHNSREIDAEGLLDTGAAVNVLPFSVGEQLGFVWENERNSITLSGNLAKIPARGIVLSGKVGDFASVRIAFAWTQTNEIRLLLDQVNFFMEYDVCFYRSDSRFEVKPKTFK